MIEEFRSLGIQAIHGWGLTETSPVATVSRITPAQDDLDDEAQVARLLKQGQALFGVEIRIVGEDGRPLPRDGRAFGELQVRGHWVSSAYLGDEPGSALDEEGWFSTGDVAVIHPDGTMQITDRKKDLIKSGGEWISSIDLENAAVRHPEIAMAAVIGVPHEKWGERPLLVAQPAPGASPTRESVLEFLEEQVAKLWLPDDVVFVDTLPLGPTGKVQKRIRCRVRGLARAGRLGHRAANPLRFERLRRHERRPVRGRIRWARARSSSACRRSDSARATARPNAVRR